MPQHDPTPEYARRQRLLRRAIFVVAALQIGILAAYFGIGLSLWASVVGMAVFIVSGLLVFTVGVRWVQAAQPRVELTPTQAEVVATARTHFVRRHGMLGFGLLWGTFMAARATWDAVPDHTLAGLATLAALRRLASALVIWIPTGLLGGYLWGRLMWRLFTPRTHTRAE